MVAARVMQWTAGHRSPRDPPGEHAVQLCVMSLPLSSAALGWSAPPFRSDEAPPVRPQHGHCPGCRDVRQNARDRSAAQSQAPGFEVEEFLSYCLI